MVCSEFAVLRKNYTQELYTQENKEIFINIFTGFIPPIHFIPPQYKNILALRKFQGNISTLKTKNFLVPLELQLREQHSIYNNP